MSNYVTSNLVPVLNPENGIPAIRIGEQVFTMATGGVNVSDTTATAGNVLSGYSFYDSAGVKTSGTIPTVSSATITPTTSNQIISSGVYLGGEQTILGDANLVSSNILSGVSIFGVHGTAAPYGLVEITSASSSSLVGREVISYSNGVYYVSSSTITLSGYDEGLPNEGAIYVTSSGYVIGNEVYSQPAIPTGFISNTSISGYVVNQSTGSGSYPQAWVVFNLDTTTPDYAWWTGNMGLSAENPAWISIQVPQPFIPSKIFIANEIESPQNFRNAEFQGSNDGTTWTTLHTITDSPDTTGYQQYIPISASSAYSHFRLYITSSYNSGVSIQAFTIYKGAVEVVS